MVLTSERNALAFPRGEGAVEEDGVVAFPSGEAAGELDGLACHGLGENKWRGRGGEGALAFINMK